MWISWDIKQQKSPNLWELTKDITWYNHHTRFQVIWLGISRDINHGKKYSKMWIFHVLSTKPFLPYLMRQLREREQAPGWMMSSADAAWKPACWVSAGKLLRSPTHQVLKHIETINKSYQSPETGSVRSLLQPTPKVTPRAQALIVPESQKEPPGTWCIQPWLKGWWSNLMA